MIFRKETLMRRIRILLFLAAVMLTPILAFADCIDGCIYDYQQCVSWCGEDWNCRNQCDEQRHWCIASCSP
jgi:hypothetical protein